MQGSVCACVRASVCASVREEKNAFLVHEGRAAPAGGWWAGPDGIPDPVPIPEILANPDPVPLEARSRPGPGSFHEPSTEP